MFQQAPTLGGECYEEKVAEFERVRHAGFNKHPPLGVNATGSLR